jgi:primosomal protein N' (replication factor Y)
LPGCGAFWPEKRLSGYCAECASQWANRLRSKEVAATLDTSPVLLSKQFDFCEWLADYDLCSPSEAYKAPLPSSMRIESQAVVMDNPDFEAVERLTDKEQSIRDLPSQHPYCLKIRNVMKSLIDKEAVFVKEELRRESTRNRSACAIG